MDGWIDGWLGGQMDDWIDGWLGGWLDGRRIDRCMDGWICPFPAAGSVGPAAGKTPGLSFLSLLLVWLIQEGVLLRL